MSFAILPKTEEAWNRAGFGCLLAGGIMMLLMEILAITMLPRAAGNYIRDQLGMDPLPIGALLAYCGLFVFVRRNRLVGAVAAVVGILLVLTSLLGEVAE